MENRLKAFQNIIDRLRVSYQKWSALLKEEEQALLSSDIKEIQAVTQKKESFFPVLESLERKRQYLCAELAAQWELADLKSKTLLMALKKRKHPFFHLTQEKLQVLWSVLESVLEKSHQNASLAQMALAHVEVLKKQLLNQIEPKAQNYTHLKKARLKSLARGSCGHS